MDHLMCLRIVHTPATLDGCKFDLVVCTKCTRMLIVNRTQSESHRHRSETQNSTKNGTQIPNRFNSMKKHLDIYTLNDWMAKNVCIVFCVLSRK